MKRPKKNKIKNPTLPENMQVDERNLIDAGESEELSFEDRIHLYWTENRGFVMGCITVLALVIIAFNGMRMYVSFSEGKIQSAYTEAVANDSLEAFAKDHSGKPLASLAAVKVADEAYTAGDFAKAAEFYALALESVENDILKGRASLGLAFADFYRGNKDEGLAQLRAVAADSSLPEAIRSEAAYHLAVDADVSGDQEAFENYAAQITDSSSTSQWQQRIQVYQMRR